ncbi:MAG: hypothetical protein ACRES4_01480, partial [Nevskiales bacterium]
MAGPTRAGCSTAARAFVEHVLARLAPQVEAVVISANRNLERYATLGWPVVTDTVGKGPWPDYCACSKRRAMTRCCVYRVTRW